MQADYAHTSLPDAPLGEYSGSTETADENQLGTDTYVSGLVDFITHSATPLTIALQGEWGSGKSSLMYLLKEKLCTKSDTGEYFLPIEINTWEMAMLNSPEGTVINILETLLDKMLPRSLQQKAGQTFLEIGKTVFRIGAKVATGNLAGASDLPETIMNGYSSNTPTRMSVTELRQKLDEGIDKRLNKEDAKGFIIFIDDLDRLRPTQAVTILEILKNIFTLRRCIFVLAIDYGVVVKGLEEKFGQMTNKNEREFRSFFDKLIQVPFSMPISAYHSETIVLKGLADIGFLTRDEERHAFRNIHKAPLAKRILDITHCTVGKNPRSIKRLLNSLSLIRCINKFRGESNEEANRDADRLLNFALIGMQVSYPSVYRMLTLQPDFTLWTTRLAIKSGALTEQDLPKVTAETDIPWDQVLALICDSTPYLQAHEDDINHLLNIVKEEAMAIDSDEKKLGKVIKHYLDRSSATDVGQGTRRAPKDADWQVVSDQLSDKILPRLQKALPGWDIEVESCTATKVKFSIFGPSWDDPREAKITYAHDEETFKAILNVDTHKEAPDTSHKPQEMVKLPPFNTAIPIYDDAIEEARTGFKLFEGPSLAKLLEGRLETNKWYAGSALLIPDMTYTFEETDPDALYVDSLCEAMAKIIIAGMNLVNA